MGRLILAALGAKIRRPKCLWEPRLKNVCTYSYYTYFTALVNVERGRHSSSRFFEKIVVKIALSRASHRRSSTVDVSSFLQGLIAIKRLCSNSTVLDDSGKPRREGGTDWMHKSLGSSRQSFPFVRLLLYRAPNHTYLSSLIYQSLL